MKISVVMAVYNGENYVNQSINSVLAQTYTNFELIIVDDGSTDRTQEILDQISDDRVTAYRLSENQGAAYAMNFAVSKAKGEWIAVHDADDRSLPNRLTVQARYIRKHPDVIAVGSRISCFSDSDMDSSYLERIEKQLNLGLSGEQLFDKRYSKCPLCHGTALISKAKFVEAGGYNPVYKITYDYDLWLNLFQLGRIEKVNKVLYQYRVHAASLSHLNGEATYIEMLRCRIRSLHQYEYRHLSRPTRLILFAKESTAEVMSKDVIPACPVQVIAYYNASDQADHAYDLYNRGEIDGIILLNHKDKKSLTSYFLGKGMGLNKNFFTM